MLSLLALTTLALATPGLGAVWPIPQSMTTGNTSLLISHTLAVTYNGAPIPYTYGYEPANVHDSRQLVQAGVSRALASIFQTGLLPWKLHRKNDLASTEPDLYRGHIGWVRSLAIKQTGRDNTSASAFANADEAYKLTLSEDGAAVLTAASSTGVLRGLETFAQLFYQHSSGAAWYTPLAPVAVTDAPKYKHRGVLLDVARNWFELEHLYRTVDAVAWNKMNRLHLHMTDSQSWPLDLPSMPEVAAKGAYRADLKYSAADLDRLQRYAVARGVELIVEIDMPGHIGSLAWSHPELVVAYDAFPYTWWCAEPPCGALKLNSSAVDGFIERLMADVLPRVAPYSARFHTGGDELNANDSRLDPGVGTSSPAVLQPLLQRFIDAAHGHVRKHGLAPMVWEEIPLDWNVTLGGDTVVQTWLGASSVATLTAAGHQVVDSNYNFWYLDCGRGQWINFDVGAAADTYSPFNDWCGPYKNWRLVYAHDPADGLVPGSAAAGRVLGGEVALWSEQTDGANVDGLLWPRACAAAEVLWSGNKDAAGQVRSQLGVSPRINEMRERMLARGVRAAPVQMVWCSQADNSTECSLPVGPGY